jgi:hypothetical protein
VRDRSRQNQEAPGQDSFLDIVANLVGILIILIMVIGVRATDAMVEASPDATTADEQPAVNVVAARQAARDVEQDIHLVDAKIKRQQVEVAYRRKERDRFLQVATVMEGQLDQHRSQLNEGQRQKLEASRSLFAARQELEDLKASRQAVENAVPGPQVIEHLPTPMAKTVFGQEVHFRLLQKRVTYVPWEELVQELQEEAPRKVWKLKDVPTITETLGPVRGFQMKYILRRAQHYARVGGGMSLQQRIELDRFVLVPVSDQLGEPLEQALRDDSEFRGILSRFNPDRTTVTVWVYPDSFNEFRTLKAALFRLGFLSAGRPMPEGYPIGGAPDGTRSAAQ